MNLENLESEISLKFVLRILFFGMNFNSKKSFETQIFISVYCYCFYCYLFEFLKKTLNLIFMIIYIQFALLKIFTIV